MECAADTWENPDRNARCTECEDGYVLNASVCLLSITSYTSLPPRELSTLSPTASSPSSSPTTSVPTKTSAVPTKAPTTNYGMWFSITYQYWDPRDEEINQGRFKATNVSKEATNTATEFLSDTVTEVNGSCVTSTDFTVTIDELTQSVIINGTVYACDNETLLELIGSMLDNITSQLQSETLEIDEKSVEILADVISWNELKISTLNPTAAPTHAPTRDFEKVMEKESEKQESTFIYIVSGLGSIICCCTMGLCCVFFSNAKKDWKRNAEEEAASPKSPSDSNTDVVRGYLIQSTVSKEKSKAATSIVPVYVDSADDHEDLCDKERRKAPGMNQYSATVRNKENSTNEERIRDELLTPGQIEETLRHSD